MSKPFQQTRLSNGLRILTERHEAVHSATLGIWIEAGSVYEQDDERGLAHLLEHVVFKGTERRKVSQIAAAMDALGGQMNAFTEREFVCYHVKVLAEHTKLALELLCDFVARPTLAHADLELERGVVLEEIRSVDDAPDELAEDLFMETIWPRSRWGRSILGTAESVGGLDVERLRDFRRTHYTPRNVLVAAVGDVRHDEIVKECETLLEPLQHDTRGGHRLPPAPKVTSHNVRWTRDTEQVHICCGTRAFDATDERRYIAWILDTVLMGGYSSRLFQEIREKRGLCYNIGPMGANYRKAGFWGVSTSVAPEQTAKVAKLIGKELRGVRENGITRIELKRAKEMARVNLLLSEESSSAQMTRIARNELTLGCQKSTEETLESIMAVTLDDAHRVAREFFSPDLMNLGALGPFDEDAPELELGLG